MRAENVETARRSDATDVRPIVPLLILFWLIGNSLRLTVLAVPPLLPSIHRTLHLDETLVGALSGLPILLLAVASVPGSYVIARVGARRALALGLVITGLGGAARGLFDSTPLLFAMTLIMALGIAVGQPALPTLVRGWAAERSGLVTGIYSNGFLIGEILPAVFTVPLVLPLLSSSWEACFVFWSIPVLATAAVFWLFAPHREERVESDVRRWWPDWRSTATWQLGLTFGCGSIAYFGSNAFLPDFLKATHHGALIPLALGGLNVGQLPSSLLVATIPNRLIGRRWPVAMAGVIIAAMTVGLAVATTWIVVWAALLGFSSALVFVLSLALPPLLAGPGDVHRLSAAMFTLSYACAAVGSFAGGIVWDASHVPVSSFLPVTLAGVGMVVLSIGLRPHHRPGPAGDERLPEVTPAAKL